MGYLQAGYSSSYPTISVKALKKTSKPLTLTSGLASFFLSSQLDS